jgi:hypothetical protein
MTESQPVGIAAEHLRIAGRIIAGKTYPDALPRAVRDAIIAKLDGWADTERSAPEEPNLTPDAPKENAA